MELWYSKPAGTWNEALPIGNGHIAGMIFGDTKHEKICLNDETIWYRGKTDRNNPDSREHLAKIRKLLISGDVASAEELVRLTMFATPRDQSHYETMGELFIEQEYEGDAKSYRRSLDIEKAVAAVEFESDGVRYRREYFCSLASNAMMIRFTASEPGALKLNCTLGRKKRFNDGVRQIENGIIMRAHAGGAAGVGFQVGCRVLSSDGDVDILGETIVIRHASAVDMVLLSATDYWDYAGDEKCEQRLREYDASSYDMQFSHHVERYQNQFKRVSLNFEHTGPSFDDIPTDERIRRLAVSGQDIGLLKLAFDFGRYLLISSSQPGGLPANLQGIWCDEIDPIWGSKYTININTEMNYWLCGPCNLPEAQLPLFDMIERMREQGRVTARKMYGARGFTCHHNTDAFGDTAPQSHAIGAAVWPLTVPWLLTHIWEQWRYTGNRQLLVDHYESFKEAFLFYEDYLFEYKGNLVTGPSVSPENQFKLMDGTVGNVCIAPTIDGEILRFFCECCLDIAKELNDNSDFSERVSSVLEKLPPIKIGKHGQIQEWLEDYDEVEIGHRHISPLFALHPGHEIDIEKTPELARAALRTIERRTANNDYLDKKNRDGAIDDWKGAGLHASTRTGWSAAWLVHFNARLQQAEACYSELMGMLANCTLPNMFCDHPPFQIDGNFGLTSGLCEMLLQSQSDGLRVLPALPQALHSGSFSRLRARGGFAVSAVWREGTITHLELEGAPRSTITVEVPATVSPFAEMQKLDVKLNENGYWERTW